MELLPILGDAGLLLSVVLAQLILIAAHLCLAQRPVPVKWHTQLGDLGLEKGWERIRAAAAVAASMRRAAHAVKARVQRLPHVWLLHRRERFCREGFEDVQADRLRNRCVPAVRGNRQEEGAACQGRGRAEAALSGGLRGVLAAKVAYELWELMLAEREGGKQLGGMQLAQLARAKMLDLGNA